VALNRDQQAQSHVRAVEKILGDIATRDGRPLSAARATNERQVGVCRHFTLLQVAMLRTQGIPARARCGFGAYFENGKYLDHWVGTKKSNVGYCSMHRSTIANANSSRSGSIQQTSGEI